MVYPEARCAQSHAPLYQVLAGHRLTVVAARCMGFTILFSPVIINNIGVVFLLIIIVIVVVIIIVLNLRLEPHRNSSAKSSGHIIAHEISFWPGTALVLVHGRADC